MERYLIDTNVVSDYFTLSLPGQALDAMDGVVNVGPKISVISQIELLCWRTDAPTEQKIREFIADSTVLHISDEVVRHCVAIRKARKVKTPDAIIAATALAYQLTLVTRNTKDLRRLAD